MLLRYKKLCNEAMQPTYGSDGAAGLDLYSTGDYWIKPGETVKISTGISVEIPAGYFGAVYARSGLATKNNLRPANCVAVIDSDYRGEIIVAMHNDGTCDGQQIHKGDRIAQMVIQPYVEATLLESYDLSETKRGNGGFGSTGRNVCRKTEDYDYEQISLYDILKEGGR